MSCCWIDHGSSSSSMATRCLIVMFLIDVSQSIPHASHNTLNQGGFTSSMVANLHQNPLKRPIIAQWLPALLRQGCMFLIHQNPSIHSPEERWMLDSESWSHQGRWVVVESQAVWNISMLWSTVSTKKHLNLHPCGFSDFFLALTNKEHLHAMGVRQFPPQDANSDDDDFPLWSYQPPATIVKKLAGNVS